MITKKSNIAVVGAGKIAYSLVYALTKNGYRIKLIISNNLKSAENLAKKYSIKNYSNNLSDLDSKAKVVLLSVPDNQIKITADKIARLQINIRDSLFIHLSGAEDISKLKALEKKGAFIASFHIMQTFPTKRNVKVENCYAAIETENKYAEKFLYDLSAKLKLKPFKLNSAEKARYHLAGVFVSNFLSGNIFNSEKIFDIKKNNNNYSNFDLLFPIIKSTLENINKLGSSKALSGPIERGDLSTIKKHISVLKHSDIKDLNGIYISYLIQSINLLNVVKSKYKKLSKDHLDLEKYLLGELKSVIVNKIFLY